MSNIFHSFDFPYEPYPQQISLMSQLYNTIDMRKIGIFESPTGTGKSLSVLCSSLNWLLLNQENQLNELTKNKIEIKQIEINSQLELDWINAFAESKKSKLKLTDQNEDLERKKILIDKIKLIKSKKEISNKLNNLNESDNYLNLEENKENLVVDYDSDEENVDEIIDNHEQDGSITKIYYCSRTHSQLNQILKELLKTNYASKIVTCCFGSRQNLCINSVVNQLKSINLINEKCLDLQKPTGNIDEKNMETASKKRKTTTRSCCQFKSNEKIDQVSRNIIQNPMDIEQLVNLGHKSGGCPFYGIKKTINKAHLVLMPYQNMLNPAARLASKIDVKENIVIIDEAHNLPDTISDVNSVKLSLSQLVTGLNQLKSYIGKYLERFNRKNLLYLRQLETIFRNLMEFVASKTDGKKIESFSLSCVDFLFKTYLNEMKLDRILNFIDKSKLAYKLRSSMKVDIGDVVVLQQRQSSALFGRNQAVKENRIDTDKSSIDESGNSMLVFRNFLAAIYYSLDARILVEMDSSLTFLVVDPGKYMKDIVDKCRSLIVIGGTMQPFSDFADRLFKNAECSIARINTFSCEHVINAKSQMRVLTLGVDMNNVSLRFTFENRDNNVMIKATGELFLSMFSFCPNGVVVFFSSYNVMDQFIKEWKSKTILNEMKKLKSLYIEQKQSIQNENIMRNFTASAKTKKGAILFAVIGAKMSEGINFSDELARLVIIVGIPYPQTKSPILREKMSFIEKQYGSESSRIMYHNLAMKPVNQAIGRAIRHKNDFAAILLLDERYANIANISENELKKGKLGLPSWLKDSVSIQNNSNSVISELKLFFQQRCPA